MIAALYVIEGGPYFGLPDVDPWPESRDARLYAGPYPVVAHPPCQRWGNFWFGSTGPQRRDKTRKVLGDDGGCFAAALASVRCWGGVLEHPANSRAWQRFGLVAPVGGAGVSRAMALDGPARWSRGTTATSPRKQRGSTLCAANSPRSGGTHRALWGASSASGAQRGTRRPTGFAIFCSRWRARCGPRRNCGRCPMDSPMTVAPWTDCPLCAACGLAVGIVSDRNERPLPPPWLYCPACGHQWQATTEDRAKAEAAERAWEAKVDK